MRRLPIRLRLTLPFALVMALVLAAMGVVIYVRVGGALETSVDQNLNAQVSEALSHARAGRELLDRDVSDGPSIAQVLLRDGRTEDSSPSTLRPLLSAASVEHVLNGGRRTVTHDVAGLRGEWRLAEVPTHVDGRPAVLVVGRSIAARTETLHRLSREFLLAAPAALLLAVIAGYLLAAAALRPVDAMRRRAAVISATTPGRRLPVPPAHDEIAALAETLNEMLARLEAAFEHERRFVSDASHELRTPLALLRAELELALRRPRTRAELEAAVESAAHETERLSRLAEDLLLLARSDQSGIPLRRERVELGAVVETVRDRFATRAAQLGRDLRVGRVDNAIVDGDPLRLEQALGNLVDNALAYGTGAVTLSLVAGHGEAVVHVADEGPGFPGWFLGRAFDRFSRADDSRSSPGTGLGLAIVALIAQAHDGAAGASNRTDGADVWVSIPLAHAGAPAPAASLGVSA